jgi:rRNA maturation endonuclease Nob1
MNDLRKYNKEGTQRRCNGCFKFFNFKDLNVNHKCKPCNTKAKNIGVKGEKMNIILKYNY